MKGYVVCVYKSISNDEKLKEYAVKAKAAVEKYKGKFLSYVKTYYAKYCNYPNCW